jgi:hypothetical protein
MYAFNTPADRDAWLEDSGRHEIARKRINEEYTVAIAFAAKLEALAQECDGRVAPIPWCEANSTGRMTWQAIAGELRDLIISNSLGASEADLDELAEQRVAEGRV